MKYVDASALLRVLFAEPGPTVPLAAGARVTSSGLVEIETFRAVDRERLLWHLDDAQTAIKRGLPTEAQSAKAGGGRSEVGTIPKPTSVLPPPTFDIRPPPT